jgi:hypothetical protein
MIAFSKWFIGPVTLSPAAPIAGASTDLPYQDYGYVPHVAQQAQDTVPPNPHLNPQPWFSEFDNVMANWFTTRVHLSPLGHAHRRKP